MFITSSGVRILSYCLLHSQPIDFWCWIGEMHLGLVLRYSMSLSFFVSKISRVESELLFLVWSSSAEVTGSEIEQLRLHYLIAVECGCLWCMVEAFYLNIWSKNKQPNGGSLPRLALWFFHSSFLALRPCQLKERIQDWGGFIVSGTLEYFVPFIIRCLCAFPWHRIRRWLRYSAILLLNILF